MKRKVLNDYSKHLLEVGNEQAWRAIPGTARKRIRTSTEDSTIEAMAWVCRTNAMLGHISRNLDTAIGMCSRSDRSEPFRVSIETVLDDIFLPEDEYHSKRPIGRWILRMLFQDPEACAKALLKVMDAARECPPQDVIIASMAGVENATDESLALLLNKSGFPEADAKYVATRRRRLGLTKDPKSFRSKHRNRRQEKSGRK